jgi:hypothetical protein
MYCPHCGLLNPDTAESCAYCRAALRRPDPAPMPAEAPAVPATAVPPPQYVPFRPESYTTRTLLGVLAFCVPPAGLFLYYIWRYSRPRQARRLLRYSVFSLGIWVILYLLMIFIALATQITYSY